MLLIHHAASAAALAFILLVMQEMTAPVKPLPPKEPGIYRFEIEPGMAGGWMLSLAAKVQGETETVKGTVTVKLAK